MNSLLQIQPMRESFGSLLLDYLTVFYPLILIVIMAIIIICIQKVKKKKTQV